MKTNYLFLLVCLISILTASCKDDSANNPEFRDDEVPYIYTDMLETASAIAGEVTEFKVLVSPADEKTSVQWLLDGEEIGTSASLVYTFPEAGSFRLRIEVTRNGLLNYRNFALTVTEKKEEPTDPDPVELKKNIFCYLSNGALTSREIDWKKMTHLCVTGGVTADGTIQAATTLRANTDFIEQGQANGVKVMMSMDLASVMRTMTDEFRQSLGERALQVVEDCGLDGINVIFEGWTGSGVGGSDKAENATYAAHLKALYQQLKTGLNDKLLTAGVKGDSEGMWGSQNAYNGDFSMFDYVDYINVAIYNFTGAWSSSAVAQHSSLEHFTAAATQWGTTNGIDKKKIILGLPAYGIQFQSTSSPTGAVRKAYRVILTEYASDSPTEKDEIEKDGKIVYYNGHPLTQQKSDYVVSNDFGGILLNDLSDDSEDDATSLLNVIYATFIK